MESLSNVREMQRNWIGRQEGAADFEFTTGDGVTIFTTRLDTIYGATFFALSPGHEVARDIAAEIDAAAARATGEFEAFRFNHALQATRELVSLLRRYREHAEPDAGRSSAG